MAGAMLASPILEGDTLYAFGYNFGKPLPFDGPLSKRDKDGDGQLAANEYEGSVWLTGMAKFRGNQDGVLDREEWDAVQRRYAGPSPLVAMRLAHVRICAGGVGQPASLPRPDFPTLSPNPPVYSMYYTVCTDA